MALPSPEQALRSASNIEGGEDLEIRGVSIASWRVGPADLCLPVVLKMTNLRLQKRLAASILGVGKRRVW